MELEQFEFSGVTGVGDIHVDLEPGQRVYTFIGANGVGKTKLLEALFQVLFLSNSQVINSLSIADRINFHFSSFRKNDNSFFLKIPGKNPVTCNEFKTEFSRSHIDLPVIFITTQSRTLITTTNKMPVEPLGSTNERRAKYFSSVAHTMGQSLAAVNQDFSTEKWFVTLANSTNRFQSSEDNREAEIVAVTRILHEIDSRIDGNFLEIGGDGRVSLKVDNQKRKLSELSSGFVSLVKLVQSIVSGYGYFTNETDIQNVKGIVLIDEIESHLHLSWQANIIPMLKKLFPNTTFFIATHSSVVLSQLSEGEAYQLKRDEQGIVRSYKIPAPNKAALADILKDVFDIDLNAKKLANASASDQQDAKNALFDLLNKQGGDL